MLVSLLQVLLVFMAPTSSLRPSALAPPHRTHESSISTRSFLRLYGKMPKFNAEEEEELRKILAGEYMDFSENVPLKNKSAKASVGAGEKSQQQQQQYTKTSKQRISDPPPTVARQVMEPNANWRTALSEPAPPKARENVNRKPKAKSSLDFLDLDYDDFEMAMMEEENAGLGAMFTGAGGSGSAGAARGKHSSIPKIVEGLSAGDRVKEGLWGYLRTHENKEFSLANLRSKDTTRDLLVLFADPRRMTDEFRIVLDEFKRLPQSSMKVNLLAVNCDDTNDQRKFLKKNSLSLTLLSDPGRKLMDGFKCRTNQRVRSALCLLEIGTGKILKIWYEDGDWDAITTKDLLVEEIKAYRADPKGYVDSQIGIR